MGQWLSERLGQQFVVDTRPGAGTNIATEAVVRAASDGYSLLLVTQTNAINATLYQNLNFVFIRDMTPVASIGNIPFVLLVNPSVPAKTVPELIAYAKTNPGKIDMASTGSGSLPHVAGELFKVMTNIDMLHVPYRGNYYADMLSGQVQVVFAPIPPSLEFVRTGRLRALAVTTSERSQTMPDIPTVSEFVAGYEASGWQGIGTPSGTPAEIINKLNNEVNAALADPTMKARLVDLGVAPTPMKPAEFGKFIANETEKWGKVVRSANIKPE
jgi:tripartite-type tricarboxylate transporter receptor subunit TctC